MHGKLGWFATRRSFIRGRWSYRASGIGPSGFSTLGRYGDRSSPPMLRLHRYEEVIGCERSSAVGSTCCTRRLFSPRWRSRPAPVTSRKAWRTRSERRGPYASQDRILPRRAGGAGDGRGSWFQAPLGRSRSTFDALGIAGISPRQPRGHRRIFPRQRTIGTQLPARGRYAFHPTDGYRRPGTPGKLAPPGTRRPPSCERSSPAGSTWRTPSSCSPPSRWPPARGSSRPRPRISELAAAELQMAAEVPIERL